MASYEEKFLEMRKYIPFLESMIHRLETTYVEGNNPREAQLNKIKALRNLLLDTTKKMKMENLLKCEQVLLNLYSKVGEADIMPTSETVPCKSEEETVPGKLDLASDLQYVREKLKIVSKGGVIQALNNLEDAAGDSATPQTSTDQACSGSSHVPSRITFGSEVQKEPLFERRPRKPSKSMSKSPYRHKSQASNAHSPTNVKTPRKYTRVLCSPEPVNRWSEKKTPRKSYESHETEILFQRRSPRRRRSRSHSSRESNKKKLNKKECIGRPESTSSYDDLNITLNVPEESLYSLNASNIFDRIVNCSESDVDIEHLRELRAQIVKELKQTGSNQDISDYILKSYKKKKKKKTKAVEVEEGEIPDSESDSLEKIYGNLVVEVKNDVVCNDEKNICETNKLNNLKLTETLVDKKGRMDSPKIKISLIISNPNDDDCDRSIASSRSTTTFLDDIANGETGEEFDKNTKLEPITSPCFYRELKIDESVNASSSNLRKETTFPGSEEENKDDSETHQILPLIINNPKNTIDPTDKNMKTLTSLVSSSAQIPEINKSETNFKADILSEASHQSSVSTIKHISDSIEAVSKPKEFYKSSNNNKVDKEATDPLYRNLNPLGSLCEQDANTKLSHKTDPNESHESKYNRSNLLPDTPSASFKNINSHKDPQNIPFLSEEKVDRKTTTAFISEIDILKALKNEILSEATPVSKTCSETPSLHQPKISKVTDKYQFEADKKRRITIENYKSKVGPAHNIGLFSRNTENKQEQMLMKLFTPLEVEKFQGILKDKLDDEGLSDDDFQLERLAGSNDSPEGTNLGPKSPEEEKDYTVSPIGSPVLIPSDPIPTNDATLSPNLVKQDVDMRVLVSVKSPQLVGGTHNISTVNNVSNKFDTDFSGSANINGNHPKPLLGTCLNKPSSIAKMMTPARDISMTPYRNPPLTSPGTQSVVSSITQPRNPSMTPLRNPSMTPSRNPSMTPSRNPSMTPSRNTSLTSTSGPLMTPTYSPMCGDDNLPIRPHVYAPSELPDPSRTPTWDRMSSPVIRDDGCSTPVWDAESRAGSTIREISRTTFWDSDIRKPLIIDNPPDFSYGTPRHDSYNRLSEHNWSLDPYHLENQNIYGNQFRLGRDPRRLRTERMEEQYHRDSPYCRDNRSMIDTDSRTNRIYPLDYESNRNRNFNGNYARETSHGQRSFRHDDAFMDHGVEHYASNSYTGDSYAYNMDPRENRRFNRASSVGRNMIRDSSFGGSYPHSSTGMIVSEEYSDRSIGLESTIGTSVDREQNISPYMRFEQIVNRGVLEPSLRQNTGRANSVGRSLGREPSIGRSLGRDPSIGRNIKRQQSLGRNLLRESSVGRNTDREHSDGKNESPGLTMRRDFRRETSVGRSFRRETSVGRNIGREPSVERRVVAEQSLGRSVDRVASVGRNIAREPSLVKNVGREQSVSRNMGREASQKHCLDREPSVGKTISCEENEVRNVTRHAPSSAGVFIREQSIGGNDSPENGSKEKKDKNIKTQYSDNLSHRHNDNTYSGKNRDHKTATVSRSNSRDPRSRRDLYDCKLKESERANSREKSSSVTSSSTSSPRKVKTNLNKNAVDRWKSKDPRYQKDKSIKKHEAVRKTGENKQSGMVYTTDNIAKGKIADPGYGVKNYKIPKIKRPVEEVMSGDLTDELKQTDLVNNRNVQYQQKIKEMKIKNGSSKNRIALPDSDRKRIEVPERKHKIEGSKSFNEKNISNKVVIPDIGGNNKASTTTSLDSDDSNEFCEILSKIKQTQVEASSDSDESEIGTIISSNSLPITTEKENYEFENITLEKSPAILHNLNAYSLVKELNNIERSEPDNTEQNISTLNSINVSTILAEVPVENESSKNGAVLAASIDKYGEATTNAEKILVPQLGESNEKDNLNDKLHEKPCVNHNKKMSETLISNTDIIEPSIENISTETSVSQEYKSTNKIPDLNTKSEEKNNTDECYQAADNLNMKQNTKMSETLISNTDKIEPLIENIATESSVSQDYKSTNQIPDLNTKSEDKNNTDECYQAADNLNMKKNTKLNLESLQNSERDNFPLPLVSSILQKKHVDNISDENHESKEENNQINENNISTPTIIPDSTMQYDYVEETTHQTALPDSTNNSEINTDASSVVSSSHDLNKDEQKTIDAPHEKDSQYSPLHSLGSILSLLQDKMKMKKILTMLSDDSVETEKLKRKLARLSELDSDEDEACDPAKSKPESIPKQTNLAEKITDSNIPPKHITVTEPTVSIENIAISDKDMVKDFNVNQNVFPCDTSDIIESMDLSATKNVIKTSKEQLSNELTLLDQNSRLKQTDLLKTTTETESSSQENDVLGNNDLPLAALREQKNIKKTKPQKRTRKNQRNLKKQVKKSLSNEKRVTRSGTAKEPITKKSKNRELQKLHDDIRDMFISDDVLNATGMRMCRLAKLTDERLEQSGSEFEERQEAKSKISSKKNTKDILESSSKDIQRNMNDAKPMVVLEKTAINVTNVSGMNDNIAPQDKNTVLSPKALKIKKKTISKSVPKDLQQSDSSSPSGSDIAKRAAPKLASKTKKNRAMNASNNYENTNSSIKNKGINATIEYSDRSFDSDEESLSSLLSSVGSDRIQETKTKSKKKIKLWQLGKIKSKKKLNRNKESVVSKNITEEPNLNIPDYNCFTDKMYSFKENIITYKCRICPFEGENIVLHYKQQHPHSEVPLSRINLKTALEAIKQSHITDFDRFSKKHRNKIICRFCFQLFEGPKLNLEKFFWHVVSKHTGEYKYTCSECPDPDKCQTSLDIPTPPNPTQALLLGFICGECHYTQISLNNLKTHVALRHDNEETEVYTINLCDVPPQLLGKRVKAAVSNKKENLKRVNEELTRKLRSKKEISVSKANDTTELNKDNERLTKPIQLVDTPKISSPPPKKAKMMRPVFNFESDSNDENIPTFGSDSEVINSENEDTDLPEVNPRDTAEETSSRRSSNASEAAIVWENAEFIASLRHTEIVKQEPTDDNRHEKEELRTAFEIDKTPHFLITASTEDVKSTKYVCRIKGCQNDYRTSLLISLKKHVQFKHVAWRDVWDGYCCICHQVVEEGSSRQSGSYTDCLNHMLMKHLDHFPVLQESIADKPKPPEIAVAPETSIPNADRDENTNQPTPKNYINVRPLSDMISHYNSNSAATDAGEDKDESTLPRIESVVSLQSGSHSQTSASAPSGSQRPTDALECVALDPNTHEPLSSPVDAMNAVMSDKHPTVVEASLARHKLGLVYKCAGKYCAYAGSTVARYLEHLRAHLLTQRDNSDVLRCAYCEFVAAEAKPLAEHVLREHGHVRFSCALCWYAATSSLLVRLHAESAHAAHTAHADVLPIEMEAQISNVAAAARGRLSRLEAAPFYTCSRRNGGSSVGSTPCKFRTYTSPSFREHLEQHHSTDAALYCFVCNSAFQRANSLIGHLKVHGLCLFQCTYCLSGADTELEMLRHAARQHPARRPQAYLRHILETKKPNTSSDKVTLNVFPLMRLDKKEEECQKIDYSSILFDDPMGEVEKANTLEHLILQHSVPKNSSSERAETTHIAAVSDSPQVALMSQVTSHEPATASNQKENQNIAQQVSVKLESSDDRKHNSEKLRQKTSDEYIICIDSDDETTSPDKLESPAKIKRKAAGFNLTYEDDVIDLSDDDTAAHTLLPSALVEQSTATVQSSVASAKTSVASVETSAAPALAVEFPAAPLESGPELRFGPDEMFKCQKCTIICKNDYYYRQHLLKCYPEPDARPQCPFCPLVAGSRKDIRFHLIQKHGPVKSYRCSICQLEDPISRKVTQHMNTEHNILFTTICQENPGPNRAVLRYSVKPEEGTTMSTASASGPRVLPPPAPPKEKPATKQRAKPASRSKQAPPKALARYGPEDMDRLPLNPILDEFIRCSTCEYETKVRSNMLRHLQMHASEIAVPSAAPVNPVPHLESNEMHFDKMTNLAASSNRERGGRSEPAPITSLTPEAAARYPKYVPEKDRYVCGAIGCSYISLDETLMKYHWETLHTGLTHGPQATAYRCVHCPPHQQLDMSRPLTASRIIGHLKMHDARLYGCGDCGYYHYQRPMVDKHVADRHGAGARGVFLIREPHDASLAATASTEPRVAPTMDLKPWHCGVCSFKTMLRPEVAEHCSKSHSLKFQFKCTFCPYSASVHTSVFRHQVERHPGRVADDVVHVYYKERSLPADEESSPLWTKQRTILGSLHKGVKAEAEEPSMPANVAPAVSESIQPSAMVVDLAIVKSEVEDAPREETLEDVILRFGKFCEPKEYLYLCPLCKITAEENKQAMISHLYEELNYRKWSCSMCPYKAFSKRRMAEHSLQEHKQTPEPIQLPPDRSIELWLEKLLEYQEKAIDANKAAKKAMQDVAASHSKNDISSSPLVQTRADILPDTELTAATRVELEHTFGPFGLPSGDNFACPKCEFQTPEESKMMDHLEMELGRVRWACSQCTIKFQNYHEAQLHCKAVPHMSFAHVAAVSKDPLQRTAWVVGVIKTQALARAAARAPPEASAAASPTESDNSLLVVRYAEEVPVRKQLPGRKRKPTNLCESGSDDEPSRLVIAGPVNLLKCPYCTYDTRWPDMIRTHKLRHFGLRSHRCGYCDVTGSRQTLKRHCETVHGKPYMVFAVDVPQGDPVITGELPLAHRFRKTDPKETKRTEKKKTETKLATEEASLVCLLCEEELHEQDALPHQAAAHAGLPQQIVAKGSLVRKCGACMALRSDAQSLQEHHDTAHPNVELNYSHFKVGLHRRVYHQCGHCAHASTFLQDLRCHYNTVHATARLPFKYTKKWYAPKELAGESSVVHLDGDDATEGGAPVQPRSGKRKREEEPDGPAPTRRVARKSTTRLPHAPKATARKSTTKLPFQPPGESSSEEDSGDEQDYSFYGTAPTPVDHYGHINTKMAFFGKMMPITVKKLSDIVNISPKVLVEDINRDH